MTTSRLRRSAQEYQPTADQLERATSLDRFNRWAIFFPVVIATLIVAGLFVLLIWMAVINDEARELASGLADLLTIFAIVPMLAFFALIPGVAIYAVIESRRRSITPIRSLQRLLWRLEGVIIKVRAFVTRSAPKVAQPVTGLNSWFVRVETLFKELISPNDARRMLHERNQSTELEE